MDLPARFTAGERDVPEVASCRPWNRTVEETTSAVSGAMEGEANEAEGICRLPAFPERGISVGSYFEKGFLPAPPPRGASWFLPLWGRRLTRPDGKNATPQWFAMNNPGTNAAHRHSPRTHLFRIISSVAIGNSNEYPANSFCRTDALSGNSVRAVAF